MKYGPKKLKKREDRELESIRKYLQEQGLRHDITMEQFWKRVSEVYDAEKAAEYDEVFHAFHYTEMHEAFREAYYDLSAPVWAELNGTAIEPFARMLQQFCREIELVMLRVPHPVIVDAGCGVGYDVVYLAQKFPDAQFVAYDLSEPMVEQAKARIQKYGLTNVTVTSLDHDDFAQAHSSFADLLYTDNSGRIALPSSLDQMKRLGRDPRYVREMLLLAVDPFFTILKPGGVYLSTSSLNRFAIGFLRESMTELKIRVDAPVVFRGMDQSDPDAKAARDHIHPVMVRLTLPVPFVHQAIYGT